MLKIIHILISIVASIVFLIMSIIKGLEPSVIAVRLAFVIIIFYSLGLLIKYYLVNIVFKEKKEIQNENMIVGNEENEENIEENNE